MIRDALIVGINQYGEFLPLKTSAGDAEAIAQLLENHGEFKVRRLPARIHNDQLRVCPTEIVMVAELKDALTQLFDPPGHHIPDTALFFFAGHGYRVEGQQGQFAGFLATTESHPEHGEVGLSLQWLRDLLQKSPVREQIIWLDCCHSGELFHFTKTELGNDLKGRSRCFIAASREFEVAHVEIGGNHGVLSGALLQGLNSRHAYRQEWITAYGLCDFVQRYFEKVRLPQQPVIASFGAIQLIRTEVMPGRLFPKAPSFPRFGKMKTVAVFCIVCITLVGLWYLLHSHNQISNGPNSPLIKGVTGNVTININQPSKESTP